MNLVDQDELSPWAYWDDGRIIAWARSHKMGRFPVAKVPLMTVEQDGPDVAFVSFVSRPPVVNRQRSLKL